MTGTGKLLDGITLALRREWPRAGIFSDSVPQGLAPGAFVAVLVESDQRRLPSARYRREPLFDVLYFPRGGREDCYAVADRLGDVLEEITPPGCGSVRGTGMEFEVVDGVLHFKVQYGYTLRGAHGTERMERLRHEERMDG